MTVPANSEADRILREYQRREREIAPDFYALYHPANLFSHQGQERALLTALRREKMIPLAARHILDIGCGQGQWLGLFETLHAPHENLAAIELDPHRAAQAQERFPGVDIRIGNAAQLPWPDETFDIVSQATMFTSILDATTRTAIAAEMVRVLKPRGLILWYDFLFNNPRNSQVRGIGRREIRRLFPNCAIRLKRISLAPPVARRIVPWSWSLARLLETFRLLNSHYLGVIKKASA